MGWLGGKIKHFFWSTMISGALLIVANSSSTSRSLMDQAIKLFRAQMHRTSTSQVRSSDGSSGSNEPRQESVSQSIGEAVEELSSRAAQTVSSTVSEDEYVLINGHYYKARADHTYLVNGEKIFFINNRQQPKRVGQLADEDEGGSPENGQRHASGSTSPASSGDSLPTSPSELMETLKKSQKAFQERNRALDEIMNEK